MNPLATWEDDESTHEKLVWWSRLDKRWQVEVQRIDAYTANLVIFDHDNENRLLHQEIVGLQYGATFGPDIEDIEFWAQRVMSIVDAL